MNLATAKLLAWLGVVSVLAAQVIAVFIWQLAAVVVSLGIAALIVGLREVGRHEDAAMAEWKRVNGLE